MEAVDEMGSTRRLARRNRRMGGETSNDYRSIPEDVFQPAIEQIGGGTKWTANVSHVCRADRSAHSTARIEFRSEGFRLRPKVCDFLIDLNNILANECFRRVAFQCVCQALQARDETFHISERMLRR